MELAEALQLDLPARVALVGAGGKTTALFLLARQLPPPVIVTTTTHLAGEQLAQADQAEEVHNPAQVGEILERSAGVICLYGSPVLPDLAQPSRPIGRPEAGQGATQPLGKRVGAPAPEVLEEIRNQAEARRFSLLVEADGARRLPLKAPAAHEPVIPAWASSVIVVAGLSGLGKPLSTDWVHRPERFDRPDRQRSR